MSSTRYAKEGEALHANRWASSPEYAEQRGIPGGIVAAKAALETSEQNKSLLFFIQAMSMKPGGLVRFTEELLAEFPERIGSLTMHKLKSAPSLPEAERIDAELCYLPHEESEEMLRLHLAKFTREKLVQFCRAKILRELPDYMLRLCADPSLRVEVASHRAFADLPGALLEFKRRYAQARAADFVITVVGKEVFARLDKALNRGKIVVIEGLEGRGKTEAAKAWCEQHLGEARYVDLTGNNNMTSFYRSIARALGLASGGSVKTTQMQSGIEDFMQRSRILLVIDEAHFAFPAGERCQSAPKMIDWIDTALVNRGVKVALVTTPQFVSRMHRAEETGWNVGQFKRRIVDWKPLPSELPPSDLFAVARKLAPKADACTVKRLVWFSGLQKSKHQLDTLVNTIAEAKFMAQEAGRPQFTLQDVERAIKEEIEPTALAKEEVFAPRQGKRSRNGHGKPPHGICKPLKEPLQTDCKRFETAAPEPEQEQGADLHNRLFATA